MVLIRSKKKNKSGKGDRIYVGVTTMLIVWSGVAWQSSEKEEGRDVGSPRNSKNRSKAPGKEHTDVKAERTGLGK